MTPVQTEIQRALDAMGEKTKFTDALLAKKLRELCKIDGKKKAVLALTDILAAMEVMVAGDNPRYYSITVTSANDLLIERCESAGEITLDAKQRRQRHEKSQVLFTSSDVAPHGSGNDGHGSGSRAKRHQNLRTQRTSMNVNRDYSDDE